MSSLTVAQPSTLSGWVHDSITSLPISGARVEVLAEGKVVQKQLTDSLGKFSLPILETQLITLSIKAAGFVPEHRDIVLAVGIQSQSYFALQHQTAKLVAAPVSHVDISDEIRLMCSSRTGRVVTTACVQDSDGFIGSVKGCRGGSNDMYIDGVRVRGIGSIQGKVTDIDSGEPLAFANVVVSKNGQQIAGTTTNIDGAYNISELHFGEHAIEVSYVGYKNESASCLTIKPGRVLLLDLALTRASISCPEVVIVSEKVPLIEKCCCHRCTFPCGLNRQCCVHRKIEEDEEEVAEETSSLLVYPNPARFQLTVNLDGLEEDLSTLLLLDQTGRKIKEISLNGLQRLSIGLEGLSNGVYFLSAPLKDKILTERFIVAK